MPVGTGLAMVLEPTFFRRTIDSINIRAMSYLQVNHTDVYHCLTTVSRKIISFFVKQ